MLMPIRYICVAICLAITPIAIAEESPLHYAAANNDVELCQQCIDEGYDVNEKDKKGFAPLHVAANFGNTEAVQTLLTSPHVDVNVRDKCGKTPLHFAVAPQMCEIEEFGHKLIELIQTLLNVKHIDVNAKDNMPYLYGVSEKFHGREDTPLHLIIKQLESLSKSDKYVRNVIRIMKTLLTSHQIDVNAKNQLHYTPLYLAVKITHTSTEHIKILLSQPQINVNAAKGDGMTPIECALLKGKAEAARTLLASRQISVNVTASIFQPALKWAALIGNANIIETLLAPLCMYINTSARTINPYTNEGLLQVAAYQKNTETIVQELISAGIETITHDQFNTSPFTSSSQLYHVSRKLRDGNIDSLFNNADENSLITYAKMALGQGYIKSAHKILKHASLRAQGHGLYHAYVLQQTRQRNDVQPFIDRYANDPQVYRYAALQACKEAVNMSITRVADHLHQQASKAQTYNIVQTLRTEVQSDRVEPDAFAYTIKLYRDAINRYLGDSSTGNLLLYDTACSPRASRFLPKLMCMFTPRYTQAIHTWNDGGTNTLLRAASNNPIFQSYHALTKATDTHGNQLPIELVQHISEFAEPGNTFASLENTPAKVTNQ